MLLLTLIYNERNIGHVEELRKKKILSSWMEEKRSWIRITQTATSD
jgi:hypothetical protein